MNINNRLTPPFSKGGLGGFVKLFSRVLHPTLLYISTEAVIPAKGGIKSNGKTGFRVKPGMTIKVRSFMTLYITSPRRNRRRSADG